MNRNDESAALKAARAAMDAVSREPVPTTPAEWDAYMKRYQQAQLDLAVALGS